MSGRQARRGEDSAHVRGSDRPADLRIACGHPDGNDADHLADDPIHKLLLGRDPVSGAPLASQPTISRFENGATRTALYRMGRELAACVIERHRRRLHGRARLVTIDLDPTDDLTHGAQQLTFFNGHYGGWCYLPLLGFLSLARIMREGVVLGETQEPPCGTNVVSTSV